MSSQSPPSIHYEVYTLDSGNRWNLHARYERNEREAALNDAKNVERTLQIPAKVVRETYYPANNQSEDALVYAGNNELRVKMQQRAQQMPRYRGGGGGGGGGAASAPSAGKVLKDAITEDPGASMGAAAKLALVVVAALTIAGTATSLVNVALDPLAGSLSDATSSLILFGTFMVTFVATALPLSTSLLNRKLFGGGSAPKRKGPPPPMPKISAGPPPPEEIEIEEELDWEDLKDEDEALPPIEDEIPAEEESYDQPEEAPADSGYAADGTESGPAIFVRFVNALIAGVRRVRPTLDAYNLFGVDLVLAGAIDVLGQNKGMSGDERRSVLKGAIEAMGVKSATAQAFADKYEEYLGEQRYMPMILSGRQGMENFLAGQDTLQDGMKQVFEAWNKPQSAAPASSRIMTVMFTDMVGSTDLTQAQGDAAAQTLVRRHNSIVRNALAQFSGKEIKHTGDGIMASFSSAASGVEAAIVIQRAIMRSNASTGDNNLHVRIGINSGEPIEEEEDLFGSTVQLAARVCAKCDTDDILCSNVVKELSSGRGLNFVSIGPQSLKGFKEQILLYQVLWRE
jgi:adenylate cyclase